MSISESWKNENEELSSKDFYFDRNGDEHNLNLISFNNENEFDESNNIKSFELNFDNKRVVTAVATAATVVAATAESTIESNKSVVYAKKLKPINLHDKLKIMLKDLYVNKLNIEWNESWYNDLPKKWKMCQDLLILPSSCFNLSIWYLDNCCVSLIEKSSNESSFDRSNQSNSKNSIVWKTIADCFKVKRIAKENRVKSDDYRTPNLNLLYGDDTIVMVNNNGIKYSYDITKCMFSWGNITEKLRIASFDCSNETVVDLFAGIGYFTLVYLIHAKAKRVIACEWNPYSVEALRNNLILNKCEDRCEILEGDNRLTCPKNCADRVNLGLIPSSEASWPTACYALRIETGGILHIHANVDVHKVTPSLQSSSSNKLKPEWIEWSNSCKEKIKLILDERAKKELPDTPIEWNLNVNHIEYVKSYGPRVDHLVLDLECRPKKTLSN